MTVGERIVEARKEKGISQKQLAEATGIPVQTLLRYEKGGNITLGNIHKISDALGIAPMKLTGWETPAKKHSAIMMEALQEQGVSNSDILSSFSTQELLAEIERRCGK